MDPVSGAFASLFAELTPLRFIGVLSGAYAALVIRRSRGQWGARREGGGRLVQQWGRLGGERSPLTNLPLSPSPTTPAHRSSGRSSSSASASSTGQYALRAVRRRALRCVVC